VTPTQVIVPLLVLAAFIEHAAEILKPLWDKQKGWNKDTIIVLIISIAFAMLTGVDVFNLAGIPIVTPFFPPAAYYVGTFLTGILLSAGSDWFHQIFKLIEGTRAG
jgi:hypothetical protein